jgi:FkbM family methyltransferase
MSAHAGQANGPAPVALFVYNRPLHTKQVLDALARNALANRTDLYVFSDGPKDEAESEAVDAVRQVVSAAKGFHRVTVKESGSNFGLATSIIRGVTEVVKAHGRVIVIEDDLVTHPAALTYFNRMLDHFEGNSGVFSISGYSHPAGVMPIPGDYPYDVYAIPRMQCWGWATWADRWEKADFSVPDFAAFNASPATTAAYAHWIGADSLNTLRLCMRGEKDVWACRWVYTHFKYHAVCICPTRSLIDNIGLDGSGSNCGTSSLLRNDLKDLDVPDWRLPQTAFVDPRIFDAFMAVMDPGRVGGRDEMSRTVLSSGTGMRSFLSRALYWVRRPRQFVRRALQKWPNLGLLNRGAGGTTAESRVVARHASLSAPPTRPLVRLGTDYGGWWIPGSGLGPDDVVLSAGAGEDISFDVELAKRYGCRIVILDPTPRALTHFEATRDAIAAGRPAPINHSDSVFYDATAQDLEHIVYRPWGLWIENTVRRFYAPANPTSVSHSIGNLQSTVEGFDAQCLTLSEILQRENLDGVTILKMDIEGAEFEVLNQLVTDTRLRPRYLLVEFHPGQDPLERSERPRTFSTLQSLYEVGYRLVQNRGWDYVLERQVEH